MAGIYIHIPFCKAKCHYCNFFSVASARYRPGFVSNLIRELEVQHAYLGDEEVGTIYFGGGTPSLLSEGELMRIFDALYNHFRILDKAEITLEANPDDIDQEWIDDIRKSPVNRLSVGVQSFFDDDLQFLNRIHTAEETRDALKRLQDKGMDNLSIDLIYGIPGLTDEKWQQNLETFNSFSLPHLSAYALTVEHKTALDVMIRRKQVKGPDEDASITHFKALQAFMQSKGYIHYEISNFALEGFYSKHNSLYWAGGHYLGLGPSAHSFNGHSRRWNKASMKEWFSLNEYFTESFEEEVLTREQRYNEYVMTSLRTIWGCDLKLVKNEFGDAFHAHLLTQAGRYLENDMLYEDRQRLFLSPEGKLFADGIASDLFI